MAGRGDTAFIATLGRTMYILLGPAVWLPLPLPGVSRAAPVSVLTLLGVSFYLECPPCFYSAVLPALLLGRYTIEREIGRGASGAVYLAFGHSEVAVTGAPFYVTIKMRFNPRSAPAVRESYFLELFNKNPFVVHMEETFVQSDHLYIVTEHCSGGDMASYLTNCTEQGESVPKETVHLWTVQLLVGVADMHRQMVAHRDLKPANLFLLDNPKHLVIGDLGLAKLMIDPSCTFTGTPMYMAPEVHLHQPYTLATDVWSIGCILYQVCMGRPPYGGRSLDEIRANIASEAPLETIPAEQYGAELSELVHSMLEKDSAKRPSLIHILSTNAWLMKIIKDIGPQLTESRVASRTRPNLTETVLI